MKIKMRYITVTCWFGIVADLLWAIGLFFPSLFFFLTGKSEIILDLQLRLIMAISGSLMLGWTLLLLWTVQKPVERRIILLFTAFPVVFGIFTTTCISVISGNTFSLWIAVKTFLILLAMISSYFLACNLNMESKRNVAQ